VRAMYYHCGVPVQAVSEYTLADYSGDAKVIVVPSPRVLTKKCWDALIARAKKGATVVVSGPVNLDEHWLPVSRVYGLFVKTVPVAESEEVHIYSKVIVRYDGEKMQRLEKAVVEPAASVHVLEEGMGKVVFSPLPLELGDSMAAISEFYKFAFQFARIAPIFTATPQTPAVLVLPSVFRDVVLYTFVSEANGDTEIQVMHKESRTRFTVSVPAQRTAMVLLERRTGRIIGRL